MSHKTWIFTHTHIKLHIIEKVCLLMNIENIKYVYSKYITKKREK